MEKNISEISINTAIVELKTLRVSNKQMTQSIFRQLPERNPIVVVTGLVDDNIPQFSCEFDGNLWGVVRYEFKDAISGVHAVYEKDGVLYRYFFRNSWSSYFEVFRDANPYRHLNYEIESEISAMHRDISILILQFILFSAKVTDDNGSICVFLDGFFIEDTTHSYIIRLPSGYSFPIKKRDYDDDISEEYMACCRLFNSSFCKSFSATEDSPQYTIIKNSGWGYIEKTIAFPEQSPEKEIDRLIDEVIRKHERKEKLGKLSRVLEEKSLGDILDTVRNSIQLFISA